MFSVFFVHITWPHDGADGQSKEGRNIATSVKESMRENGLASPPGAFHPLLDCKILTD
jgi:hypothetical protein